MKMGICSAHTTGGHLMGVGLVQESRRLPRRGRRHVPLSLRGRAPPSFRLWCLRDFSLFGLMRMDGSELLPPSPPCMFACFYSINLYALFMYYQIFLIIRLFQ